MDGISSLGSARTKFSPSTPEGPRTSSGEQGVPTPEASPVEDAVVVELTGESREATDSDTKSKRPAPSESTGDSAREEAEEEQKRADEEKTRELEARDREVRAHEQAHLSALGPYKTGGASYTYETGPDGRRFAVGGEVPVDVSPESEPEETIKKAQTIRRAALAPAEPSAADRAVAAQASQLEATARAELASEDAEGEDSLTDVGAPTTEPAGVSTDQAIEAYTALFPTGNTERGIA